jgi:diguanylate cyclase (GGDEF)-like protein
MRRAGSATREPGLDAPQADVEKPRHGPWPLVTLVALFLIGALLSANLSMKVAQADNSKTSRAFAALSVEVTSSLQLETQHEVDLLLASGAYLSGNPQVTESSFRRWAASLHALHRYPELLGMNNAVVVREFRLAAFSRWADAHPWSPFGPHDLVITPSGTRPSYCLSTVGVLRSSSFGPTSGYDFCSTGLGPALLAAEVSGSATYAPFRFAGSVELGIAMPYFRGGLAPSTVVARHRAFLGWFVMAVNPKVLLDRALAGHHGVTLALSYDAAFTHAQFGDGSPPSNARELATHLSSGWTVRTYEVLPGSGVLGDPQALQLLLAGLAISALLSLLFYALATGRARAGALVAKRTDQLQFQALHDPLTSLPNRALILDRIEQMLGRARRDHVPIAAMFLDLDDFKYINDTLGHHVGDELLVAVGSRLESAMMVGDTVGRIGGDEYVLLIEGPSLSPGAEVVADRILEILDAPFHVGGCERAISVSASIGIAVGDRSTPGELLRDADIALYQAKAAGKRCCVFFSRSMQDAMLSQEQTMRELHAAVDANQFRLFYQLTVDLHSNAFTGVEALLRWDHPDGRIVQPDDFIPALESTGMIVPVGAWVLEEACRQGAAWHAAGHHLSVAVNVSAKQLQFDRIIEDVRRAIATSGFDPKSLVLELTETGLMNDIDATIARLRKLKALGVVLAVDDFGTGYSSLSYLQRFPIDILKIDRSFVSGETASSEDSIVLLHTLIHLGKALNLKIVAEGIEEFDQLTRLRDEGVECGQGFLFARPEDVSSVEHLLLEGSVLGGRQRALAALGSAV